MQRFSTKNLLFCVLGFAAACRGVGSRHPAGSAPDLSDPPSPPPPGIADVGMLPPIDDAALTTALTLSSARLRESPYDPRAPSVPENRRLLGVDGYGNYITAPGLPYHVRSFSDAEVLPPPGPNPRRLTRFVHLTDLQLADDESPARVAMLDGAGETNAAFRPQEGFGCHIVAAAVRTINALHRRDPFAFTLLGGDTMDNTQENELGWALTALSGGGMLNCDSGADDDPIPGPNNDPKDPFFTEGLLMPSKWVTGNHDVLVQGNVAIDPTFEALALGTQPKVGTRDYRHYGAPITEEDVPPDPARHMLYRQELMQRVAADGDGHGIGPAQVQSGKAFYWFDIAGTPLRMIVLDTSTETGGSEGTLLADDIKNAALPMLDQAKADGKWIILSSHHAMAQMTVDGGTLGFAKLDSMPPNEWRATLASYPIVYAIVAHTHEHRVSQVHTAAGTGYWEVMTASLMDYPAQFRVIEIFDQDNGWLMLRATCVDYSTAGDPLAEEGRTLTMLDWASGWGLDGTGSAEDLNVELWIKKPGT